MRLARWRRFRSPKWRSPRRGCRGDRGREPGVARAGPVAAAVAKAAVTAVADIPAVHAAAQAESPGGRRRAGDGAEAPVVVAVTTVADIPATHAPAATGSGPTANDHATEAPLAVVAAIEATSLRSHDAAPVVASQPVETGGRRGEAEAPIATGSASSGVAADGMPRRSRLLAPRQRSRPEQPPAVRGRGGPCDATAPAVELAAVETVDVHRLPPTIGPGIGPWIDWDDGAGHPAPARWSPRPKPRPARSRSCCRWRLRPPTRIGRCAAAAVSDTGQPPDRSGRASGARARPAAMPVMLAHDGDAAAGRRAGSHGYAGATQPRHGGGASAADGRSPPADTGLGIDLTAILLQAPPMAWSSTEHALNLGEPIETAPASKPSWSRR